MIIQMRKMIIQAIIEMMRQMMKQMIEPQRVDGQNEGVA